VLVAGAAGAIRHCLRARTSAGTSKTVQNVMARMPREETSTIRNIA
jgi:hypothetical protein